MRPLYAQLKMQHYSANESRPGYVPRETPMAFIPKDNPQFRASL